ncbi:DUF423 domain-containing protein [Vibrio rumoiensis]|uniref:DUF423 domain-containing protein n=1 Tax=Vibrio rumoiensis 1S-45 TaxID=1188252 RepID=A0A1E5E0B0_9VIBR|nr:DUF423 domain-containing protein [Vibrio rumoiensis]OEF23925.1 hypothetical protein A1QC_01890 [Vibrio rumoiensis 1S-45]
MAFSLLSGKCKGDKILAFAGFSGLITVALGAFAAHGLSGVLSGHLLSVFKTGVQYQAWHTFALLACGILLLITAKRSDDEKPLYNEKARKGLVSAGICFIIGILCFSGSLYGLALTGIKWFGPITPLGGLFFMIGWLLFALSVLRLNKVTQ